MIHAYLFLTLFIPLTFLFAASAFDGSGRVYAFHAGLWSRLSLVLEH